MSIFNIPLRNDLTHYAFFTTLDGVTYELEFRYNLRSDCWYFDLRLEDGTEVLNGIKLVVNYPLLLGKQNENTPAGVLIATDTTGQKQDPGVADLGGRVTLAYYDAESAELLRTLAAE